MFEIILGSFYAFVIENNIILPILSFLLKELSNFPCESKVTFTMVQNIFVSNLLYLWLSDL